METEKKQSVAEGEDDFYLRYYCQNTITKNYNSILLVGHKGKFGHEFLEFEFRPNGRMRYANNSQYKSETLIRKEVYVNDIVLDELKRIIKDSEIIKEDDRNWPEPDKIGRQELEILIGSEHISFTTSKLGSFSDVKNSKDPDGLTVFHYLIQDLKCFVFSIISLHFRIKPVQN